jgi:hypothetical protein
MFCQSWMIFNVFLAWIELAFLVCLEKFEKLYLLAWYFDIWSTKKFSSLYLLVCESNNPVNVIFCLMQNRINEFRKNYNLG